MGKKLRFWCKILTGRADGGAETLYIIYIDKEKPRRISGAGVIICLFCFLH